MTLIELSLAISALLVTPGPTNTLLAVAGGERGWMGAIRLIPSELAGYLTTVVPLAIVGTGMLERWPDLRPVITLAAAAWVLWLAFTMWRLPALSSATSPVATAGRIYVTTVLNPKALLFGLVLIPAAPVLWVGIVNFACQVVVIAAGWAALGHALSRGAAGGQSGLPRWLRRVAAGWLAIVGILLLVRVAGA